MGAARWVWIRISKYDVGKFFLTYLLHMWIRIRIKRLKKVRKKILDPQNNFSVQRVQTGCLGCARSVYVNFYKRPRLACFKLELKFV